MSRGRIILTGLSTTALLAAAAGFAVHHRPATVNELPAPATDSVAAAEDAGVEQRPVYPYSVIAGGVYSPEEFATARDGDAVVAAAYPTVDPNNLYAETVDADVLVYMSYRKDDRVYWTRRKIALRRGETIFTDGEARIRGRCGNGISDQPMTPTADAEPDPLVFDTIASVPQPLARLGPPAVPALAPLTNVEGGPVPSGSGLPALAAGTPLPISSAPASAEPAGAPLPSPLQGSTNTEVIAPGLLPPVSLPPPASLAAGLSGTSGSGDSPLPGLGNNDLTFPSEPSTPDTPGEHQGDSPRPPVPPISGVGGDSPNAVVTPEPSTLVLVGGPIIVGLLKRRRSTSRR